MKMSPGTLKKTELLVTKKGFGFCCKPGVCYGALTPYEMKNKRAVVVFVHEAIHRAEGFCDSATLSVTLV